MDFLYTVVILPIERIVDFVFALLYTKFDRLGIMGSIAGVSIAINFLALPLYAVADALQLRERNLQNRLLPRVNRIKAAFKGDERFMVLNAYYRQNNYHTLYVIRGTLPILIELPFFIAAYHFLSHCDILQGSSFWIFKDLGAADGLFKLGSFTVNVLPIIMTAINVVSGAIYTKGAPFKEKAQLYAMAALFLVLLYNSPSGLVIYWILNNIFSLCKNVVMKFRHPLRILFVSICAILVAVSGYSYVEGLFNLQRRMIIYAFTILFCLSPLLLKGAKIALGKIPVANIFSGLNDKTFRTLLFASGVAALYCLLGWYLPSAVVATSPEEFSFIGNVTNPVYYIKECGFYYFGLCVFWPTMIYLLFGLRVKKVLAIVMPVLSLCALLNATIFANDYGNLSVLFDIEKNLRIYNAFFVVLPVVVACVAVTALSVMVKFKNVLPPYLLFFVLAGGLIFVSGKNLGKINKEHGEFAKIQSEKQDRDAGLSPVIHLSKTEKNVLVVFLDRAFSSFFDYIVKTKPELASRFDGFTYYPNTVSQGVNTRTGSSAMMGGYEYTPFEMNKRDAELLRDKHNEATLVMPRLFSEAGFSARVFDPPVVAEFNYSGDLSAFDAYPEIKAETLVGRYNGYISSDFKPEDFSFLCGRNMQAFVLLEAVYPPLRDILYENGFYFFSDLGWGSRKKVGVGFGYLHSFISHYSTLSLLPKITSLEENRPTFTFLGNDTAHERVLLTKNYEIPKGGDEINNDEEDHFQINMAAYIKLCDYFDFLREKDVYDNTRIIIVADHDWNCDDFKTYSYPVPIPDHNPILLVKDFDCHGQVKYDNSFMTNADTLFLAKKDLPVSDKNPFTGKVFTANKENGVRVIKWVGEIFGDKSTKYDILGAYLVKDNIFDEKNWKVLDKAELDN